MRDCQLQDNRHLSAFERHAELLKANEFIEKNKWSLTSSHLNSLDYHAWDAMLVKYTRAINSSRSL